MALTVRDELFAWVDKHRPEPAEMVAAMLSVAALYSVRMAVNAAMFADFARKSHAAAVDGWSRHDAEAAAPAGK